MKSLIHRFGRWYINRLCRKESENQTFSHHNERLVEYRFALQALTEAKPKTVLDVGAGPTAWPHLLSNCGFVVTAIDNVRDYWPAGMVNRHWEILDEDILNPAGMPRGAFEAVTCISVLEHIEDHARAMKNMTDLLVPGGHLILTTPYSHQNSYPDVYKHPRALYGPGLPYICRSSCETELTTWLSAGLTLEREEFWSLFTGPVWATGERAQWRLAESRNAPHQLGCFVFRKAR
jgi:SAM-dependent methyltransferase